MKEIHELPNLEALSDKDLKAWFMYLRMASHHAVLACGLVGRDAVKRPQHPRTVCQVAARFAQLTLLARRARRAGEIAEAELLELSADSCYQKLPGGVRW